MSPKAILKNLELYIQFVQDYNATKNGINTKIILVSPPKIRVEKLKPDSSFDTISDEKLRKLSMLEVEYCHKNDIEHINLYDQCIGNELDGIHLEASDNHLIADLILQKIQKLNS